MIKHNHKSGKLAEIGKLIKMKYTGTLLDGTVFDSGTSTFHLGKGEVIKCWELGAS